MACQAGHQHWATTSFDEAAELATRLRSECERLQSRCQQLATELVLAKATVGNEIRDFVLSHGSGGQISLAALFEFLHSYSGGLVAQEERQRKRGREVEPQVKSPLVMQHQNVCVDSRATRKRPRDGVAVAEE